MKISEILQTIFWLGLLIYIASVTVPDQAAHRRAMIEAFESVRQPKAQTLEGLLANEFLKEISIAYGIGTRCTVETSKLAVDTYGAFGMVFAYKQPTH